MSLYNDFFPDFDKTKADAMLADLRIQAHDKIGAMSKGTQEKMQLCLTMSRAAKLYLLDEPLGGVDPAARDYILQTILHNYSEDAALVLSTHLIGDIEKVLDEVIFLQNGKVLHQAAVDELREETGMSVVNTSGRSTNADKFIEIRVQGLGPRCPADCKRCAGAEHFHRYPEPFYPEYL